MSKLDEIRKKRFQFLNLLYENTGGNRSAIVNMWELGVMLEFDKQETQNIVQYLEGEHLLVHRAIGGAIGISHYGIKEVEEAISNPEKPTQYFPPVNIIQIHHMEGSQIQQGTSGSSQTGTFNFDKQKQLHEFLTALKSALPDLSLAKEDLDEVNSDIETIESQLKSSRPKGLVVTECLKSVRNILEGAAGSILAAGLLSQLAPLF